MTFDLEKARADLIGATKPAGYPDQETARVVHLRMSSLLTEIERLRAGHCVDCCCARSWEALGISEYTGKSIPEEITHLREWMSKNRDAATELQYQLDEATTRIKELEEALVEERANANRSGTGYFLMSYLKENNIDPEKYFSKKATEQLQAEGKIGTEDECPDDLPPIGSPYRSWQTTEERKAALEAMCNIRENIECPGCGAWLGFVDIGAHMAMLRAMLQEADQK